MAKAKHDAKTLEKVSKQLAYMKSQLERGEGLLNDDEMKKWELFGTLPHDARGAEVAKWHTALNESLYMLSLLGINA